MTSCFRNGCSDLDEIRYTDAEWHVLYSQMVEIETGSRIPIWRTFVFNGSSYISAVNWDISTKFGLLIEFELLKAVTSTDTKPEVVFSGRGRHLGNWIWRRISAVGAHIRTKFGILMQNNMQITAKWSRSKLEAEFQYGGRLFFKNGSSYSLSQPSIEISTKFGLLIDFDILKAVTSTIEQIRNQK